MRRREFLVSISALAFSRSPDLTVNGFRVNNHLKELSRFGRTPEGGISRVAYSNAGLKGREHTIQLMQNAGLDVITDYAGNLVGRKAGSDPNLPPIMFGSHIDSVPHGGNYDGQVGAMGAIEVAHTLHESSRLTRHPLEVIIFQNEENGKIGSRALAGELKSKDLELPSYSSKTIREGITFIGGNPDKIEDVRRHQGDVAAYLELHIEQGALLHQESVDIGVVEGIVGIKRWSVAVHGHANHAGTTPMNQRQDAMVTAGRFITEVERLATTLPGRHVATVGKIEAHPGAPNVVPGRVELSLEIRDLQMSKIDKVYQAIAQQSEVLASINGTKIDFREYYLSRAAPTDERIRKMVETASQSLGLSHQRMPSGAGHDAQSIALFAPTGMIFIPSIDGISHSPKEYSRPTDIEAGTNTLLHTLLQADTLFAGA